MSSPLDDATSLKQETTFELDDDMLNCDTIDTVMAALSAESIEAEIAPSTPSPAPEKKPVKKRKSWGQELPTPTTNLPPRKRAKTEAEKEQRRIERVLRNRAAAQSSRERKRLEVEQLQQNRDHLYQENILLRQKNDQLQALCKQLSKRVDAVLEQNQFLARQLKELCSDGSKAPEESMADFNPLLLTPPASITHDIASPLSADPPTPSTCDGTLDPSHLSTPSESNEDHFGLTQHTAVMLCHDLPCHPKTGLSLEPEAMWVNMRWILLMTTVLISPLLAMISLLVTKLPIPGLGLPLYLLSCFLIWTRTIQCLRREPLTISHACALPLDATALAPWFECTSRALGRSLSLSWNGSKGMEGKYTGSGDGKSVEGYRNIRQRNGGSGESGISNWRLNGVVGFDFRILLFQGKG